MNLSFDFPESSGLAPARVSTVQTVVAKFTAMQEQPESPVRAIQRQPASEGRFAAMPDSVHAKLREALAGRGIR